MSGAAYLSIIGVVEGRKMDLFHVGVFGLNRNICLFQLVIRSVNPSQYAFSSTFDDSLSTEAAGIGIIGSCCNSLLNLDSGLFAIRADRRNFVGVVFGTLRRNSVSAECIGVYGVEGD